MAGIEPAPQPWRGRTLPLRHTRTSWNEPVSALQRSDSILRGVLTDSDVLRAFPAIKDIGDARLRKLSTDVWGYVSERNPAWTDIERVRILTTDQGPQTEDVFFVIDGKNRTGCMVSQELATRGKLLEALQGRLDGLNNASVIEAMLSVENKVFTIWQSATRTSEETTAELLPTARRPALVLCSTC